MRNGISIACSFPWCTLYLLTVTGSVFCRLFLLPITFYFAVPYLTIICHNNKLHVFRCLQSLPLVLSKNHGSLILFPALIQQSACKRKYSVSQISYILLRFYYTQICSVFLLLLLMEVFLTYKAPQDLITESRRVVQNLSQPFSFLQLKSLSYLSSQENIPSSRKTFAISKAHLKEG